MTDAPTHTQELLQRWNQGDRNALKQLLSENLSWIQSYVHRRLGNNLRQKAETNDIVQEAVVEFLRHGPRFVISDSARFRALLAKIVENTLGHHYEWYTAKRRAMSRERPLPSDSVLQLDHRGKVDDSPSQIAAGNERESWVRLGLELLNHKEREVLLLRVWSGLSFSEIASRLGIEADAARMRFHRALHRMGSEISQVLGTESFDLGQEKEDPAP